MLNRRDLLKLSAGTAAVGSLLGRTALAADPTPATATEVKRYRILGRTGEKISDFSMGGGSLMGGPALIRRALELGVTYFDTAPDYGDSEKTIGAGWKLSGVSRDKFHITTKCCEPRPYPGHAPARTPEAKLIAWVEGLLKRLQTDYIDNLFVHAVGEKGPNDVQRLKDPDMLAALDKLKQQGKIRFKGVSSHGPYKILENLTYAIESGVYDVIMPAYNLFKWKGLDKVIELAKSKNVGVIAMKVLRGGEKAKEAGALPPGNFAHAAFKWVWSNENVAGLIATTPTIARLEQYLKASGGKLAMNEASDLVKMAAVMSPSVCRIGCGDCLTKCSKGVSIPDVFRHDMYYTDYGETAKARAGYAELAARNASASVCQSCTDQTCLDACTYGIPIRPGMQAAHRRLV